VLAQQHRSHPRPAQRVAGEEPGQQQHPEPDLARDDERQQHGITSAPMVAPGEPASLGSDDETAVRRTMYAGNQPGVEAGPVPAVVSS